MSVSRPCGWMTKPYERLDKAPGKINITEKHRLKLLAQVPTVNGTKHA